MPIAEDLDDAVQLRAALLDRDRRIVRLRSELVAMERWIGQLQGQVEELAETADNARSAVEHLLRGVPDLLEPEVDDLAVAVADDVRSELRHAWTSYKKFAWGHDQLLPVSGGHSEFFDDAHPVGLSIVEALGTLYFMGLDAELVNYEWKVYLENTKNLNYRSTARASWIGDFSDPISFLELYTTTDGNNRTGFSDPAYDQAVAATWTIADPAQRMAKLKDAEAILMDRMPVIPLYYYSLQEMRSPKLQNAVPNPLGQYTWKDIFLSE